MVMTLVHVSKLVFPALIKMHYVPVNVSCVVNFSVDSCHARIAALVFHVNGRETQVRSHGEVGNGSHHCHACGDVVEDAFGAWLHLAESEKGKGRYCHDGTDSKVEVGAMCGDGDLSNAIVDVAVVGVERVVHHDCGRERSLAEDWYD